MERQARLRIKRYLALWYILRSRSSAPWTSTLAHKTLTCARCVDVRCVKREQLTLYGSFSCHSCFRLVSRSAGLYSRLFWSHFNTRSAVIGSCWWKILTEAALFERCFSLLLLGFDPAIPYVAPCCSFQFKQATSAKNQCLFTFFYLKYSSRSTYNV